jgi:hypothetical protein
MMKEFVDITEEEVKEICRLAHEPYISFMTNSHGKWNPTGLQLQIETTSTLNGDKDDSVIWISKNGLVRLWRNNGNWGGSRDEEINALPITDYLRKQGYEFNYSKPNSHE